YITSEININTTFLIIAIAMGIGSYLWGFRVTETLSEKVTPMDHHEGLAANLTTSLLVGVAARFGLPVSTTQVSSGAIIGVGLKHGVRMIGWKTVTEMILAWLITLPVSAILAYFAFHILSF
ncbi:MAG: inorganic phosphate transporter, partial [Thermodesulfobacteriota bacterium]